MHYTSEIDVVHEKTWKPTEDEEYSMETSFLLHYMDQEKYPLHKYFNGNPFKYTLVPSGLDGDTGVTVSGSVSGYRNKENELYYVEVPSIPPPTTEVKNVNVGFDPGGGNPVPPGGFWSDEVSYTLTLGDRGYWQTVEQGNPEPPISNVTGYWSRDTLEEFHFNSVDFKYLPPYKVQNTGNGTGFFTSSVYEFTQVYIPDENKLLIGGASGVFDVSTNLECSGQFALHVNMFEKDPVSGEKRYVVGGSWGAASGMELMFLNTSGGEQYEFFHLGTDTNPFKKLNPLKFYDTCYILKQGFTYGFEIQAIGHKKTPYASSLLGIQYATDMDIAEGVFTYMPYVNDYKFKVRLDTAKIKIPINNNLEFKKWKEIDSIV